MGIITDHPIAALEKLTETGRSLSVGRRGLLRYTYQCVKDVQDGIGWDAEYPQDVWDLRRLGIPRGTSGVARLRFDRIAQPWLRELTKRWIRHRLSTGLTPNTVGQDLAAVVQMAAYLEEHSPRAMDASAITRDFLERWIAVRAATRGSSNNGRAPELHHVKLFPGGGCRPRLD